MESPSCKLDDNANPDESLPPDPGSPTPAGKKPRVTLESSGKDSEGKSPIGVESYVFPLYSEASALGLHGVGYAETILCDYLHSEKSDTIQSTIEMIAT